MRISTKWLAQYVDLPPVEELAGRLTAVGFEVEAIERSGGHLAGVVAARILSSEKHPSADKLSVTRVDAGRGEPLQIVCGAKNYQVGDVVPLAMVGTTLPGGTHIERATLRGVESNGMLCSSRELGIDADASGLFILPRESVPGTSVAEVLHLEDVLLEINVTPNRPDALSHFGIAREVAAALGIRARPPAVDLREQGGPASDAVSVRIDAPEKCHRYAARVVEGVRIGPSPRWLAARLEACGIRSISNVVDVTNFVLLELGHPLHAFDLDRVAGHQIIVRTAGPGERITTLDGKERVLDPDDLLIGDRDRGSALAGVMGGGDSEIHAGTTRVLIESAWFAPGGVRRTSRRHGLKTEASYRFERGADPGMVVPALDRCAQLVAELAGGSIRRGVVDANPRPYSPSEVALRWARPAELLGMPVERRDAESILAGLGFEARGATEQGARFVVPSWRQDVSIEEDLVEEIVRTKGYEAIPETLPRLGLETPVRPRELTALGRVRDALEGAGFSEAVNFSFVAPAELAAFHAADGAVPLENPISAELAVMRTSVVPSLLRNAAFNVRQRVADVRLYEIARAYSADPGPGDEPAREQLRVAGVLMGRRQPVAWTSGGDPADFYDAKAAVEAVLESLGVEGATWRAVAEPWGHPRFTAAVEAGSLRLGAVGELHPRVAAAFGVPRGVLAFELSFEALLDRARIVPRYAGVPRFPAVLRDLAVVVDDAIPAERVVEAIRDEPLVEAATLFDVYTGAPIPAGRKNLAFALRYRAPERTLTDAEVDEAHRRMVGRLRTDPQIRAELRG